MTPGEAGQRRERMVTEQLQARGIRDKRVLAAMRKVPRERFVDESMRERAYEDAHTAADTAAVDQRRPILGQSADTLTCGSFRRAGQLN